MRESSDKSTGKSNGEISGNCKEGRVCGMLGKKPCFWGSFTSASNHQLDSDLNAEVQNNTFILSTKPTWLCPLWATETVLASAAPFDLQSSCTNRFSFRLSPAFPED